MPTAFIPRKLLARPAAALVLGMLSLACGPSGPKTGTQTNWLKACQNDAECGDLQCLCGTCTLPCGDASNCSELSGAECVADEDRGAIAMCGGTPPESYGMCLPRCSPEDCPEGSSCVAGVCTPMLQPNALVVVDETERFQTLVGIGSGLGYVIDEIVQHPRRAALFDAMFSDSGLTMLRVRNRFGLPNEDVASTTEIISAAAQRLGQIPGIILTSASPPPALKQNASNWCEGNPESCMLARLDDGSFDYAGLANHLRASLEAYAAEGVNPTYLSLQNNPNWVPATGDANEACRFLPREGTAVVTIDGSDVEVEYPGYVEALEAVRTELANLASMPQIVAPESTNYTQVDDYMAELAATDVDAIAHHLYGTDTTNLDLTALAEVADLGTEFDRPVFQSEMHADPLTTAVLMHASFAVANVAVYIQNGFVASASDMQPQGLINLTGDDFVLGDPYHVIGQYSQHIGPGWVRVAVESSMDNVLASAWVSPDNERFVVVLTNPGSSTVAVQVDVGARSPASTMVTRTSLAGVERSAVLGELPPGGLVSLPGQSMVTVTFQE